MADYLISTKTQGWKRYKGRGATIEAITHNRRIETFKAGNIISEKSHLNYSLHGESDTKNLIADISEKVSKVRLRKNAVTSIEFLFTLPFNRDDIDYCQYFETCYKWLIDRYGKENIISFDIHLDEGTKHAHGLVFPLIDGKLQATKILGSKKDIYAMRNSFYKAIQEYKLNTVSTVKPNFAVVKGLLQNNDLMLSPYWNLIQQGIRQNPASWLQAITNNNLIRQLPPKNEITYSCVRQFEFSNTFSFIKDRFLTVN